MRRFSKAGGLCGGPVWISRPRLPKYRSSAAWRSTLGSRPIPLVHASLELQPQSLGGELHQWRHLSACGDEIPHQFGAADLLLAERNRCDKVLHLQVVDKGLTGIESAEDMNLAHPVGDGVILLKRAANDAFDDLTESLVMRSSWMERGATFKSVRSELLNVLASYVGSDADSMNADTVVTLQTHLERWFNKRT